MSVYKGGYITVDLEMAEITSDGVPIKSGTYARLVESLGKPVIIKNANLGGTAMLFFNPLFVLYDSDASELYFVANTDNTMSLCIDSTDTAIFITE